MSAAADGSPRAGSFGPPAVLSEEEEEAASPLLSPSGHRNRSEVSFYFFVCSSPVVGMRNLNAELKQQRLQSYGKGEKRSRREDGARLERAPFFFFLLNLEEKSELDPRPFLPLLLQTKRTPSERRRRRPKTEKKNKKKMIFLQV